MKIPKKNINSSEKKTDSVIKAAGLRLELTLAFLGVFTLANFLLQNNQVDLAKENTSAIAFFESQNKLVQEATLFASVYAQSIDVAERKIMRENIRDSLEGVLVINPVNGEKKGVLASLPPSLYPKIRQRYLHAAPPLNPPVKDYIASIKEFMMSDPIRISSENPRLKILQKQSLSLGALFQETIRDYQKQNREQIETLQTLGVLLFGMTLFCLVLIGFFIFLPTTQTIAHSFGFLKTTNEGLERLVSERTAALEHNARDLAVSNEQLRLEISERLHAEQEVRKTNVFLDSIIENIPHMIFIKDAKDLRYLLFNRAGEDLVGRERDELLGKRDYDFFPQEEADFFVKTDREALEKVVPIDIPKESIHTQKKGIRVLHTRKIPIKDSLGNAAFLLGISEDITEQLLSEQKMQELSMAMENALDGVARLDSNLKFLNVNRAFASMLGYGQEELVGINYMVTVCPEDQDQITACLNEISIKGKAEAEVKVLKKDGSIFHQYAVFVRVFNKENCPEGFYCFTRDVTEQKYKESIEIKSELIQMVSHELRTPIHSIKEGISIVLEGLTGDLNEEQKEVLSISKRCIDRLVRLINDVLAFHKLEAGVVVFHMQKTDLNKLLREVAELMRPLAEAKGLAFRLELQKDLPLLEADKDKIVQVLTNFIQNAIKFTPKGEVTVISAACPEGVKIAVKDTGIGIQKADLPKLFRKFGQLESAKLVAPGGTGLGLAICKKIIEQHRGTVGLESEYNQGSVFSFILPLSATP